MKKKNPFCPFQSQSLDFLFLFFRLKTIPYCLIYDSLGNPYPISSMTFPLKTQNCKNTLWITIMKENIYNLEGKKTGGSQRRCLNSNQSKFLISIPQLQLCAFLFQPQNCIKILAFLFPISHSSTYRTPK